MIPIKRKDIHVAILRIEGTNNEEEVFNSFMRLNTSPEILHLKEFLAGRKKLDDYQLLVIPGGFSTGDYVRAGAIFASLIKSKLKGEISQFVNENKPVLGICNGFQVLVELGLLPGFKKFKSIAALTTNDSGRFECRPTLLKHESRGNCIFTKNIKRDKILAIPSAHAEGKFVFSNRYKQKYFKRLIENDQIVFRYVNKNGEYDGYPWNPNGSIYNIAGICNPSGNVFGMMPHPERVFYQYLHSDWTRRDRSKRYGDGKYIFDSVIRWIERKF